MKTSLLALLTKSLFIATTASFVLVVFKVLFLSSSVSAPTNSAVVKSNSQCIITVDSIKYDVSVFKNYHSGGDIFNCGIDMTSIFYQQHNQQILSRMAQYKI